MKKKVVFHLTKKHKHRSIVCKEYQTKNYLYNNIIEFSFNTKAQIWFKKRFSFLSF